MSVAAVIDTDGLALVTGGASGFGLEVGLRLAQRGMRLAVLDVSAAELKTAEAKLREAGCRSVLPLLCDVAKFEECQKAQEAVTNAFPGVAISFLFNNAGILGAAGGKILEGPPEAWKPIFNVNVFGAVNIIKAFLPGMIQAGPLPSGKKSFVVTTSSVVGLLNHSLGPYSISKMAATAMCEQLSIELEDMGPQAAHVAPCSLHPTVAGTGFLEARGEDGSKTWPPEMKEFLLKQGVSTAASIVDGLFHGLAEGRHYIIVDHELDIPTKTQIAMRMEDQMQGSRPRKPEQLGHVLLLAGDKNGFKKRQQALQSRM